MFRMTAASTLVLVLLGVSLAGEREQLVLSPEEQKLIDLTNAERKTAELKPLKPSAVLMEVARAHAANMAKQGKAEHVLDGKNPSERVKEAGYRYAYTGENVAWNQDTPKEVLADWMESKPHKENILKPEYTEIGVAEVKNKKGERYWVQVFGTPRR
jgi:uncharacterized protein YkwD